MAGDGADQPARFQRLGQVIIHAGLQTALAVTLHGVGRHSDDGCVGLRFAQPNGPSGFVAVQNRHLAVHQNHVNLCTGIKNLQGLTTITGQQRRGTRAPHQRGGDFLVNGIVLDDEHVQARQAA